MLKINVMYKDWNKIWRRVECKGKSIEEVKGIYCLDECEYKILKIKKI